MNSNHYAHGTNSNNSDYWLGFTLSNSVFNTSSSSAAAEDAARDRMVGGEGPKLENFLGATSGGVVVSPAVSNEQQQKQRQMMCRDGSGLMTIGDGLFGRQINGVCEQAAVRKTVESFGQRTSVFRGVTRHRWTGRYEAHLWDNSCRREEKSRKGRQVYLGGYDKEDKAARAYDLAALKYWGPKTATNFPIGNYKRELEEMKNMTRQEFVASLRRRSSGFSRGASMYRGVTRHHQHGRWQARIGRVAGNKDLYLGTFSTQEEAAEAYDIAAIKFRGLNAVTNFDMSRYDVKSIANNDLPIGGIGNKPKTSSESISEGRSDNDHDISESSVSFAPHQQPQPMHSSLNFALPIKPDPASGYWPAIIGYGNNHITLATPSPNSYHFSGHFHSTNMNIYCASGSALTGSEPGSVETSTMIPYNDAIPTSVAMANSVNAIGTHECNHNGISNWIAPSKQEYQSGKPSLSMFQTPIFDIE